MYTIIVNKIMATPTFEIPMDSKKLKIPLIIQPKILAISPRINVEFCVKNKPVNEKILL